MSQRTKALIVIGVCMALTGLLMAIFCCGCASSGDKSDQVGVGVNWLGGLGKGMFEKSRWGDDVGRDLIRDNFQMRDQIHALRYAADTQAETIRGLRQQTAGRDVWDLSGGTWAVLAALALVLVAGLALMWMLLGMASWIKSASGVVAERPKNREYRRSVAVTHEEIADLIRLQTRTISWFRPIRKIGGWLANWIIEKNGYNVLKTEKP